MPYARMKKLKRIDFKKKRPKEKNTNPLKLCKLAFIQLPPPRAKKAANFISGSRWGPGNFWSAHDFFPTAFGKQKTPKKNQAEWPSRSTYDSIPKVKSIPGLFREDTFEGDGIEGGQISSHVFLLPQFFRSSFSPQKNVPSGPKNSNRTCRGLGKFPNASDPALGIFQVFFWRGGPWETHLSPPQFFWSQPPPKIGIFKWRNFLKMVRFPNKHGKILLNMIILGCFGGTTIWGNTQTGKSPHQPKNRKLFFFLGHFRTLRHLRWEKLQMFKFGLRNSWSNELEDWQSNSFSSSIRNAKKQQRCDTVSTDLKRRKVAVFNFISTSEIYDFFARQIFKKLLPSKWHPFWTCHRILFAIPGKNGKIILQVAILQQIPPINAHGIEYGNVFRLTAHCWKLCIIRVSFGTHKPPDAWPTRAFGNWLNQWALKKKLVHQPLWGTCNSCTRIKFSFWILLAGSPRLHITSVF